MDETQNGNPSKVKQTQLQRDTERAALLRINRSGERRVCSY
ncbi:MAG: hypothetical protein ACOX8Q_01045 [Christensenellales bacterium]